MTLKEKGVAFIRSVSAVCLFDLSPPFYLSALFGCHASWIVEYCTPNSICIIVIIPIYFILFIYFTVIPHGLQGVPMANKYQM